MIISNVANAIQDFRNTDNINALTGPAYLASAGALYTGFATGNPILMGVGGAGMAGSAIAGHFTKQNETIAQSEMSAQQIAQAQRGELAAPATPNIAPETLAITA